MDLQFGLDDNEELGVEMLWLLFAQLGVKIDFIQDNGVVDFSVPSMSDYTALTALPVADMAPEGTPLAGELLLNMANDYFRENGLTPNGRIRTEYWTTFMGQVAGATAEYDIWKG